MAGLISLYIVFQNIYANLLLALSVLLPVESQRTCCLRCFLYVPNCDLLRFILWVPTIMTCNASQFSGYQLQTAQFWANAGVTEDGHCQGACRPQWFFYVPN